MVYQLQHLGAGSETSGARYQEREGGDALEEGGESEIGGERATRYLTGYLGQRAVGPERGTVSSQGQLRL